MGKANLNQINLFKERYCYNEITREKIINDFSVDIETYEELLPGNTVKSYATGNRDIKKGFVVFRVYDSANNILYYPVFSESIGRKLAKVWGLQLPRKMTIFVNEGVSGKNGGLSGKVNRNDDNKKMLQLIQYARSMMILHVLEPEPMRDPFKSIYEKLEQHPNYRVFESDIKSINTAIHSYLESKTNKQNENFSNLQEYIEYIHCIYPDKKLRDFDFELLRNRMMAKYPKEHIVF